MSEGVVPFRWSTPQSISYTASSATATAVGTQTRMVRLISTTACHVHVAQPAVAATVSDTLVTGSATPEYIAVAPGDIITVIQDSANGKLSIVELTF